MRKFKVRFCVGTEVKYEEEVEAPTEMIAYSVAFNKIASTIERDSWAYAKGYRIEVEVL